MRNIVSIIVPVFNVEKYIATCIESILNQTSSLWELILVDDGSSDMSGNICEEFSKKDERIKVFHTMNRGVSSARNIGIKESNGKWLTFLDSDDYFELNTIEFILNNVKDLDILRFGIKEIYNGEERILHVHETDRYEVFFNHIIGYTDIVSVCAGVYRKSLFEKGQILFDESLRKAEDWKVLFSLVKKAKKVKVIDIPLYKYNKTNEHSCTNQISYEKEFDSLKVFRFICENVGCRKEGVEEALLNAKLLLYHKVISQVAILERFNLRRSFYLAQKTKNMLGIISISEIRKTNSSIKEKIVNGLSLYCITYPFFVFIYVLKYKKSLKNVR